jgi:uncharacterized membrane protein YeiH
MEIAGMTGLPALLDFAAVFIFALTGALSASRAQLDVIGFVFLACVTAVGGGTVRDLLLDRNPVFWIASPHYIAVACLAAVLVFFGAHFVESRLRALVWLDAVALAVAVPAGVAAARGAGAGWPTVLIMGVLTGCLGGLMRDVVCNILPLVLRQGELYVTAAFAGAFANLAVMEVSGSWLAALAACAAVTFALRAGSLALGWRLPVYRSRPPRS